MKERRNKWKKEERKKKEGEGKKKEIARRRRNVVYRGKMDRNICLIIVVCAS